MARWKLTADHYLNSPGTEWEYKETDRTTGKQGRKVFEVPLYVEEGSIVCHGVGQGGDITFLGDPTPDMEPLDDEARAISNSFRATWAHPINDLPTNGDYSASLVTAFEKQISTLVRLGKAEPANPISANSVSPEEFKKLQEQVGVLMARNAELEARAEPKAARRA